MDLQIRDLSKEFIEEIELLKRRYKIATNSKMVEYVILNFEQEKDIQYLAESRLIQANLELKHYREKTQQLKELLQWFAEVDGKNK